MQDERIIKLVMDLAITGWPDVRISEHLRDTFDVLLDPLSVETIIDANYHLLPIVPTAA